MRISDWSSDVCSSDLEDHLGTLCEIMSGFAGGLFDISAADERDFFTVHLAPWASRFFTDLETAAAAGFYGVIGRLGRIFIETEADRKSVVEGKSVSVRVDLGGRRTIKKKKKEK